MSPNDELWGTFAVDDHLRRRAFVAEVVLFDRLLIPEPPENDEAQYADWVEAHWEPDSLKSTLGILGDLAIPVPWEEALRKKWRKEYKSLTSGERASLRMNMGADALADFHDIKQADPSLPAMYVTRRVIAKKLKGGLGALDPVSDEALYRKVKAIDIDPAAEIEVVVGYGSCAKFREEVPIRVTKKKPADQSSALLFRWDFVVPSDSSLTDDELLERAVKLSDDTGFRDSRRSFHEWRRRLLAKRVGIEEARKEMERCLVVYNNIVAKNKVRSRSLTALQVVASTAPLADFVYPGLGAISGVVLALGVMAAEKIYPERTVPEHERIAALVYDSRKAFGWYSARRGRN